MSKIAQKSTVEQLREIRDKVSSETQNMSFEELKKYVEERLTLHPLKNWSQQTGSGK